MYTGRSPPCLDEGGRRAGRYEGGRADESGDGVGDAHDKYYSLLVFGVHPRQQYENFGVSGVLSAMVMPFFSGGAWHLVHLSALRIREARGPPAPSSKVRYKLKVDIPTRPSSPPVLYRRR